MKRVTITAHQHAELLDLPEPARPLAATEIRGRTLVSLVSPGTELNWAFLSRSFPVHPGYACVFEVTETGADVAGIAPGDVAFASGGHCEFQQIQAADAVKIPAGLAPETAVFARLMGVSMSTLNTTAIRPPERVLVTGLGPVGNLAAQIFAACGYAVTASDPLEARRELALRCGLRDVRASAGAWAELAGQIGLHVECSGHEQAALDGCKAVRKRGEVVLVGVPWQKRSELSAFELLHAVFHRYAVLRSGWEWEVPRQPVDFNGNSLAANYAAALRWLAEGRIRVEGLAQGYAPVEAQAVYGGLLAQSLPTPGAFFDWRQR